MISSTSELIQIFYNVVYPLAAILINVLGIYAATLLLKRTRTKGPWILLFACITSILVSISFPIFQFLFISRDLQTEVEILFYLAASCADLLAFALQGFAIALIAYEFRALLNLREMTSPE